MITRTESEVSNDVENLQVQYRKVGYLHSVLFSCLHRLMLYSEDKAFLSSLELQFV